MRYFLCLSLVVVFVFTTTAVSANTVGWRNDGTGIYPDATPVLNWSTTENVVWKTPLPDWGNSMVSKVDDRLFVNVEPDMLICLSADSGQILWERHTPIEAAVGPVETDRPQLSDAEKDAIETELRAATIESLKLKRLVRVKEGDEKIEVEKQLAELETKINALSSKLPEENELSLPSTQRANGYTSATPISDGEHVWVLYGSGIVACYDMEGNRQWAVLGEQPTHQWGHSSSPHLADGKLIVHVLNMIAYDAGSGEKIWTRNFGNSFGTSVMTEIDGAAVIATPRGDVVRASDGARLASGLMDMEYGCPIVHEGVLYGVDNGVAVAYKVPDSVDGNATEFEKLWESSVSRDRYYSSPMVVEGVFYAIGRGARLVMLDAATGEEITTERMNFSGGRQLYGSFSLANGHLFIGHENGEIKVLKPGRELNVVATNNLSDSRSTPIFDGSRMYFRTLDAIYCIGE